MNATKKILLASAFLLLASLGFGQSILRISPAGISGLPDTVRYGDTLKNMAVTVLNDGPLPVAGQLLDVQSQFNGGLVASLGNLLIPTATPLLPGDSLVVPLDAFVVSPQNSNNGSNIVVVWPASPTTQPGDSAEDTYYVDDVVAIQEAEYRNLGLTVYPNPASDQISVTVNGMSPSPMAIELRTIEGKLVYAQQSISNHQIDLSQLPVGMYLLRVTDPKGHSNTQKILKR